MPTFDGSGWGEFLEEQANWPAAYFGYQDKFGTSPNMKRYFRNQVSNVQNQFMGKQAQQIMGGDIPSLRFEDFLAQFFAPQGGASQQWGALSPSQRGTQIGGFVPPTRWFFPR